MIAAKKYHHRDNYKDKGAIPNSAPRPDEKKHREYVEECDKNIRSIRIRINLIEKDIREKNVGHEEYIRKKGESNMKVQEVQTKIDALEAERKLIQARINESVEKTREARDHANRSRKGLPYSSIDEIDSAIAKLENDMMVSSLSLKQEKKLMTEIENLKIKRPEVQKMSNLNGAAGRDQQQSFLPLKTQLDNLKQQMGKLYDLRRVEQAKYKKVINERQATQSVVKPLVDEKSSLRKEEKEHDDLKKLEIERHQKELRKYDDAMRVHKANYAKKISDVRQKQDLKKKMEEAQKHIDSAGEFPFEAEVNSLKHLRNHIKNIMLENFYEDKTVREYDKGGLYAPGTSPEEHPDLLLSKQNFSYDLNIDGILVPKKERDAYFVQPVESKKKKKKDRDNTNKNKNSVKSKISFDVDTLSAFEQFNISTPVTLSDFEQSLKQLDAKDEEYQQKRLDYEATTHERQTDFLKKYQVLQAKLTLLEANDAERTATEKIDTSNGLERREEVAEEVVA